MFSAKLIYSATEDAAELFTRLVPTILFSLVPAEVTRVSAGLEEGWSVGEKLHVEQGKMKKESNNKKVVVVKESKEEPTPQREDPSVVKYSVTTTPYLQR